MIEFNQKRFDELFDLLKATRKRHEEEIAIIEREITKIIFHGETAK